MFCSANYWRIAEPRLGILASMVVWFCWTSTTAWGGETLPADTGLAQRLRQQISSGCYGFVDHAPGQIRGYVVNDAFQLTRDGYPWARFGDTANLLIQREEVLVGGSGNACGNTSPGGTVNMVTRRGGGMLPRMVFETDQFGRAFVLAESSPLDRELVQLRLAVRREEGPSPAGDAASITDLVTKLDFRPQSGRLIRLDLEVRDANEASGVAWPVDTALPRNADRRRSLEQDWSRYRYRQQGLMLAWEEDVAASTRLKLGYSQVRYRERWDGMYFSPQGNPALPEGFIVDAYRVPRGDYEYDAWHSALERGFNAWDAAHLTRLHLSRIEVGEPDRLYPLQALGLWAPGQKIRLPPLLPATAARRLESVETRLGLNHTADWTHWQVNAGLRWTQFADSNAVTRIQASGLAPMFSIAWKPSAAWRIQWTGSQGQTGRQFASLSSSTPSRLQPPGKSREDELGVRWQANGWQMGMAAFAISKPYRFEQQTVSVWRGSQEHRGYEATLGWEAPDDQGHVVFTGQAIKAQVTGTGEPALELKRPPGIPGRRFTLYADWKPEQGSPWSVNLLGEYQSSRMTLDDNRVVAPGYVRWDAGLERRFASKRLPVTVAMTIRNLTDASAWEFVGGGVGYLLAPRTLSLTFSTKL